MTQSPNRNTTRNVHLRRYLTFFLICLWFGGFTVYSALVVPIANDTLPFRKDQGFVTRLVAIGLNGLGLAMLAMLVWETRSIGRHLVRVWRRGLWASWWLMAAGQTGLLAIYPSMNRLLDPGAMVILDKQAFRPLHKTYLILCTLQWAACIAYCLMLLPAWTAEFRGLEAEQP